MFKPKARRYSMHLFQCNSIHIYAKGVKTLLRYSKYLQFFFSCGGEDKFIYKYILEVYILNLPFILISNSREKALAEKRQRIDLA